MNEKAQLRRSLTLFAVVCLGINGVIGQGIFLLPGKAAARMGPAALIGLIIGGLLCFCIALCFAEVGSQAVSYTTGVPAMIGATLMLNGKWHKPGVFNLEQFDPDPFMDLLNKHGLPWLVTELPEPLDF